MAKANLYLKEPNSKEETLINCFFSFDGLRIKLSTGIKILPKFWNENDQAPRNTKDYEDRHEVTEDLKTFKKQLYEAYNKLHETGDPITKDKLKREFLLKRGKIQDSNSLSFFEYCEKFLERAKREFANGTYRGVKARITIIKIFASKNGDFSFEDISLKWYRDFTDWLRSEGKSKNTIAQYVGTVKMILNSATDEGINKNLAFKSPKFKRSYETVYNIYLSESELLKMYQKDLSKIAYLERVRDLFIVGSYTGLRFSDLAKLTDENFQNGFITLDQQKTSGRVVIPVHPLVKEILEKYDGKLPRVISNQKYNVYIKEVGKLVEIDEEVIQTRTVGGKSISTTYKKYELIASHTARRSMATNMYLAGVPILDIMRITGHKTPEQFLKYIKVTELETAQNLKAHSFFS